MTLDDFLEVLVRRGPIRQVSGNYRCICPAHDDHEPSLDVKAGDDGRILLICRSGGCKAQDIVAALGLTMRDLFTDDQRIEKARFEDRIDCVYSYKDERGNELFQTVRLFAPLPKGKDFRQRHRVGDKWEWNLKGCRRILYRLPKLIEAPLTTTVFIAEGEKDCQNLAKIGAVATTNPMGAGKWRKEYAEWFRGRNVVILPDNDEPGRKHAKEVYQSLSKVAASVKIVALPNLPHKGDASDWIAEQVRQAGPSVDYAAIGVELVRLCNEFDNDATKAEPNKSASAPSQQGSDDDKPRPGAEIILEYFNKQYKPVFRRKNHVICRDGAELHRIDACAAPTFAILAQLSLASNAPTVQGKFVNEDKLPGFFKKWAPVAWGEMFSKLPDEDHADLSGESGEMAADEFRRLFREGMLTQVVLGDIITGDGNTSQTRTERRSMIDWCHRFAKLGPWKGIRSYKCWCKLRMSDDGELTLHVAVRPELFGQLKADKRLYDLSMNKFTSRCERYGIGTSFRENRPKGMSTVVLDPMLVADLVSGLPPEPDDTPMPSPAERTEHTYPDEGKFGRF